MVEAPGDNLSALAHVLGADQATASALVDRLLAADLVRRDTDPNDRRRLMLHPTEKALRLAAALAEARRASEERIRAVLGNIDTDVLTGLLSRLIAGLDDVNEPHPALTGAREA